MTSLSRAILGVLMVAGASLAAAAPASAYVDVGISFGDPGYNFDPCDYYDYYDEAPPWGLPQDYCEYPVYFEPVFFDGSWYRGPIYYRWTHGRRLFWLNGGWREDGWRGGSRPGRIAWSNRGGHFRNDNWRGRDWHGGVGRRPHDSDGDRDRHPGTGNNRNDHQRSWVGVPPQNHDHDGGDHGNWGGHGGDHGGGSHFGGDHGGFGGDHGGGGGGHHH